MNTADLARWFQLHRAIPEMEAIKLAEEVVIRRKERDADWDARPAVRGQLNFSRGVISGHTETRPRQGWITHGSQS